jgi:hypothetical protein
VENGALPPVHSTAGSLWTKDSVDFLTIPIFNRYEYSTLPPKMQDISGFFLTIKG